jgi:CDP-diacylglycerol--serine O-phosphatidyltransferase
MEDNSKQKWIFFLPNTFTALNMACGFMAILFSIKGEFYQACIAIGLGAIFDSVDGRVARMTGTQSPFGEQFDSMSDMISFGVAPAFIFYFRFLSDFGRLGIVFTFLFILCGALRLARFNANIEKVKSDYFQGLPSPGSALAIVSFVMASIEFGDYLDRVYITVPYITFYALLMVSNIPFPSGKNSEWAKKRKKRVLFIMFMVFSSLAIYEELMLLVHISLYVLGSMIYVFSHKTKFDGIFDWKDEEEEAI